MSEAIIFVITFGAIAFIVIYGVYICIGYDKLARDWEQLGDDNRKFYETLNKYYLEKNAPPKDEKKS